MGLYRTHVVSAFLASVVAAMAFGLPGKAARGATCYISGRVVVQGSKRPATGATVSLFEPDVDSDPEGGPDPDRPIVPARPLQKAVAIAVTQTLMNGAFLLVAPRPGEYRLTITGEFYVPWEQAVTVLAKGLTLQDVPVEKRLTLQVTLLDKAGRLVTNQDAELELWILYGNAYGLLYVADAHWSAAGGYEVAAPRGVAGPEVQRLQVEARCAGIGAGASPAGAWPADPLTIHLDQGCDIAGVVADADGKPVAGMNTYCVRLREPGCPLDSRKPVPVMTDTRGSFEFSDLIPGQYEGWAVSADGVSFSLVLNAKPGRVEIKLAPHARPAPEVFRQAGIVMPLTLIVRHIWAGGGPAMAALTGRIIDEGTDQPVPGATVMLSDHDSDQLIDVALTGPAGTFSLQAAPDRLYTLCIDEANHLLLEKAVRVGPGGKEFGDLALRQRDRDPDAGAPE